MSSASIDSFVVKAVDESGLGKECGGDLRVYFKDDYKKWVVDVTRPKMLQRRSFKNKNEALKFAKAKRDQLVNPEFV